MSVRTFTKIVAYYRLSKPKKGKNNEETIRDAYGLEDQRREVAKIAAEYGAKIIGEFQEIVTGRKRKLHREQLKKAISMARMHKAVLVIGKQDRLARNVAFIANLMEAGVDFICADRPHQSKMETHFRAVMDEEEGDRISDRTKRAMRIAKEKGILLGSARPGHWAGRENRRGFKQAAVASALARTQRARDAYSFLIDHIVDMNNQGMTLDIIADRLNALGHQTTAGKPFHKAAVYRVFKLFGKEPRPKHKHYQRCSECNTEFTISTEQLKAHEKDGTPYLCWNCCGEAVLV